MRSTFIVIGVFLLWISIKLCYNEAVVFKFTNAVCQSYNESWVHFNQCRLRAVNRNRNILNINGTILHPVNDVYLHLQILKRANGYKPWLFNVSLDACRFVKKAYNPFAKLIFSLFKEFSNFNHSCPYVGTQLVQGFYLRSEILQLVFPSGDYLLAMTWYFDKKPQFITNVYFVFTEDLSKTSD
ncbi:uncharacterized protein LOC117785914 [Drosophila innubila]|uniref:uncharacterized protein LOC117785914 n=1 Tax=Drosophila innubila TaxID=198719 RepID=UPI00148BC864|nr:uncharacterized protein LOC117785914 [Drosophila innubila]